MSGPLTFRLLGGAAILEGDDPLDNLRSRTAEALLIYLACHDRPLSRQFLADFFWDDRTQKQASANLRSILSMLRKRVGDYLTADRQTIAFNRERPFSLDSAEFEDQIRALEPQLNQPSGLTEETYRQLEAALSLYQGDFLAGFHLSESRGFEEWVVVIRERLRRLAVLGLRRLVQYHLENGRYQEGIIYAGRLIEADPYNEEAQRQRMWLLMRSGQRNAALQSYHDFARLLEEDLSVDPSPATTAVYEKITTLSYPPPDNLSAQPTPFVGREEEIQALFDDLVRPDGRLVTIVGPGGAGKTRLAAQTAGQLKHFRPGRFLDGLWFVPLAPVPSGRYLVTAVANALGLSFRGTASPQSQLIKHLQNREMLLILDNFEHLLVGDGTGPALISEILAEAQNVKLLVTSREQLDLREELIFDIVGLPYPADPDLPAETAETYSAVALFLQSARRVSRRFAPEASDFQAVNQICALLEGMPLGLEMAAAWVRHDAVNDILSRLEQSLEELASTWRNVPQRHRSMRSVFDHSWRLLTAEEQAGFARLAVFQGGFTPAAALAVAEVSKPSVFQGKSLLRKEEDGRFDLHNLIQQFTIEILQQDSETWQIVQRNHARYYLSLLHDLETYFTVGPTGEALNRIDAEIENIRPAWAWAVENKSLELLNQGFMSLYFYYDTRGWFEEGRTQFEETTAALSQQLGPEETRTEEEALIFGRLRSREGWFAYRCSLLDEAEAITVQTVEYLRRLDSDKDLAQSINDLGIITRRKGEYEKSKLLLSESLAIRQRIDDRRGLASSLNNLANTVRMLGEYEQAQAYLLECLDILKEHQNLILEGNTYNNLGEISRATGNYEEAREYYEASLAIRQKTGNLFGIASCLNNLGSVAHTQGDYESARRFAQESLAGFIETGDRRAAPYPLSVLGRIARDEGDFAASFAAFRRALQICYEINYTPKSLDILFELATVLEAKDEPAKAIRLLAFVIHHPKINHETKKASEELFESLKGQVPGETAVEIEQKAREENLETIVRAVLSRELER